MLDDKGASILDYPGATSPSHRRRRSNSIWLASGFLTIGLVAGHYSQPVAGILFGVCGNLVTVVVQDFDIGEVASRLRGVGSQRGAGVGTAVTERRAIWHPRQIVAYRMLQIALYLSLTAMGLIAGAQTRDRTYDLVPPPNPATTMITTTTPSSPLTTAPSAPTTTIVRINPSEVTVLVLNAAAEKGLAAKVSQFFQGAGYVVLAPRNADFILPSKILYSAGKDAQAVTVAAELGLNSNDLATPLDPSNPPAGNVSEADVIVILGADGVIGSAQISGG